MPYGVAQDSAGNIYIADYGNNQIRKVTASSGNIGPYAGGGTLTGNGVTAQMALLKGPVGLAFDAAGNLYESEFLNHCVRKITPDTQTITTVIGTCGTPATSSIAANGDGGAPTAPGALLNFPEGVAVNPAGTTIYVADSGDNKVRWVNQDVLNTFAGDGMANFKDGVQANQAEMSFPSGVALDALGNLFIGDSGNNRVRKVVASSPDNVISTVAGSSLTEGFSGDGGPAVNAQLARPFGISVNPITNGVYVSDFDNNRIRLLSLPLTPQTISFGPLPGVSLGVAPIALTAMASSGLAVTFASTTVTVCTVTGNTATVLTTGTCTITASQAGNSTFAAATPVTQSFTVSPPLTPQTITFGPLPNVSLGVAPFSLTATASSGLPVTFTSTTTTVCTVNSALMTPAPMVIVIATGTCSIVASQNGNATFAAATPVTQSFTVSAPTRSPGPAELRLTVSA
jgi:DNA-binding beta-propeller fold protein YncE